MIESVNFSLQKFSWIAIALISFLHGGAIACVLFLNVLWWIKFIIIAIVVCNWVFISYKNFYLHKKSIVKICQISRDEWQLWSYNGELMQARLCGDSIVTGFLIILNFAILGKRLRKTLLLFPDMFDRQTFRRLRVQLLTGY